MTTLDFITIIAFAMGIIAAGLSFSKSGKNMKSFFAAGGEVAWWISGLSLFMGFFSAGTFVVWGSIAYSDGLVAITIQMCMCIAGFVVGFLIAPKWKKTNVLTAAEYISTRFGVATQKTYTYIFLLISLFTSGSFLYPVAKIVEVSTGLPLYWAIALLGVISILYVAIGGLWAVVVTDVLQFVILTAAVIIVVPLAFSRVGGVSGFIEGTPTGFFELFSDEYTPWFLIAFCIYNLFFLGGNWSYVQRYTSVSTPQNARKVGLLFGGLYLISPILWMLPPMIYRVFNGVGLEGLANEGAYLLMCKEALPSGLLGLMLGGMVFATASSLNGSLNISAGVFTNDIFKKLYPTASNELLMKVARYSTLGFGLLAIVVASLIPLMGGIVNVVISVAALTGVPIYMPIIWTLFSKRQTRFTILFTTLFSLGVNATFKFITPIICDFSLTRTQEMVIGVVIPFILLVMFELYQKSRGFVDPNVELCLAAANKKREEERAIIEAQGVQEESNESKQSLRVIGLGILLTGIVITALGTIADAQSRVIVIVVGAVLALGGLFIYKNKK
ncbi:MAG: sodium:solute symporter family protein [Rikenellaceae bacterium]